MRLEIQDQENVKNTYYRAPKVIPNIKKESDEYITIYNEEESVDLTNLEETIFYILVLFKFIPLWLIEQWVEISLETMLKYRDLGLVWFEETSMGVFLRPTRWLLDLYEVEDDKYIDIPFGLLNHTCAEEQLMFDIITGNPNSELWELIKGENLLPRYHPLGIQPKNESGSIIIREQDFRIGFRRYKEKDLLEREEKILNQIKAGIDVTDEFSNFSMFPIISYRDDKVVTQTPDLLIPIFRDKGKAKSYAIEIELSIKQSYEHILENYKDNNKFGSLFYLVGNNQIANKIKKAYIKLGGLGSCELFLLPYQAPAQKLEYYFKKSK